jgi:hypothetical protein
MFETMTVSDCHSLTERDRSRGSLRRADTILQTIEVVVQSNEQFFIDGPLHVSYPTYCMRLFTINMSKIQNYLKMITIYTVIIEYE